MIEPNKDYSLAIKTKSVTKNGGTVLLVVLFLIVILTVGFVWTQTIDTTKKPTVRDIDSKNMKNLTVKNDLQNHDIEVIAPTDANFNAELTQYIGNYNEVIPLVNVAKPFTVFIKNN